MALSLHFSLPSPRLFYIIGTTAPCGNPVSHNWKSNTQHRHTPTRVTAATGVRGLYETDTAHLKTPLQFATMSVISGAERHPKEQPYARNRDRC
jgi:hypothetical protein